MTEALKQVPDADLIVAVRAGDKPAFGVLYERHLVAARRAAACLAKTPAEREDLVAEAFTRVLRVLRDGRGPQEEFRPYLLVTLRNTAINATTRGAPVTPYADVPEVLPADGADGPVMDRWDATVAADAFASLPERWRVVLWHTEVENESPAAVAPMLGMRPNSVAALAYRAREGLRQAYLRMQVPEEPRRECKSTVHKLAGYVRHSLPLPLSRKIDKHLTGCAECRRRVDALRTVNDELRALVGPAVLGTALAAAYLPAPAAVTGAVGALSGAAGVLTGSVAGSVSGTLAGAAVPVLAASDTAAAVSSVLAVKATVVQVAAAVAIAAASTTVSAAAPADSTPSGPAALPVSEQHSTAGSGAVALTSAPAASGNSKASSPPTSPPTSNASSTSAATSRAKSDKPAAKQAKAADKAAKKAAKKGGAAQDDGTTTEPPKKSKEKKEKKKDKKPKKARNPKKK